MSRHSWPRFPRLLEIHLSGALRLPNANLAPFLKVLMDKFGSWGHHPRILNLYMRQFDQPIPLPPSVRIWSPEIETSAYAFIGLSFASRECMEYADCNILRNVLHSRWPQVWDWMDCLYRILLLPRENGSDGPLEHSLRLAVEDIFLFLLQDPIPRPILLSEGVLALAITMWIHLAEHPPSNETLSGRIVPLSRIVLALFASPDTDQRVVLHSDRYRAARSVFKPIEMSIHGGPDWAECLPWSLRIHTELLARASGFYRTLPVSIVIPNLCDALTHAISHPLLVKKPEFYKFGITFSLTLLWNYSEHIAEGYSWVIYALRQNLLPSLLKCMNYCSSDNKDMVITSTDVILSALGTHSIYHPVLRYLRRETILNTTFEDIEDKELRSKWLSFSKTVHLVSSTEADLLSLGKYTLQCVDDQCKQEKKPEDIRRCTGCKMAWYCSKDCQKRDWVKHRSLCGENRPSRDPFSHPRTRSFFRHFLEEQMSSRQEAINEEFKSFHLNSPTPQPLILLFDCNTEIPPKISIHPPEIFDQFTYPDVVKVPMLMPCIRVRYGARYRDLPLPSDLSGELFGWFEV